MPIAARASDPVVIGTRLAMIDQASQLPRAAPRDRHQHFAVHQRDAVTVLVELRRGVLPKCIGYGRHLLAVGSGTFVISRFVILRRCGE